MSNSFTPNYLQRTSYLAVCGLGGDGFRFRQLQFRFKTAVLSIAVLLLKTAVLRHLARLRLTLAPESKGEASGACELAVYPSPTRYSLASLTINR